MNRSLVLRGLMVAAICTGLGVVLLRDDEPARNGWNDCTAPQLQRPLPLSNERPVVKLEAELVNSVAQPVALADAGDTLLVGSLTGEITATESNQVVLDLSGDVLVGAEQGLLDIELDSAKEWLYVSYSEAPNGDSRVRAWPWTGDRIDTADGVEIFHLEQPHRWHNGGGLAFGPDGHLYLGLGDGGSDDIEGALRARNLSSMFGSILRIDPTPETGGYDVPSDNPFVDTEGAAPEILHYGLRNPWRFSFDEEGRLWIADVGQYCVEEIDMAGPGEAGVNFGWPGLEGTYQWAHPEDEDARPPVYEYLHVGLVEEKAICSISGGEVYGGSDIPALRGAYVFADLCDGQVRAIRLDGDRVVEYELDAAVESPIAVIADDEGELYITSFQGDGSLFRLTAG